MQNSKHRHVLHPAAENASRLSGVLWRPRKAICIGDLKHIYMAIYKVEKVPLIPQPTDGVCWYASCRMIYKWSQATGQGSMKNPADDAGFKQRFDDNGDWWCGNNGYMAEQFRMKKFPSLSMDYGSLSSHLSIHGPTFASLQKNWGGNNYGHAVVIVGVADTGVLIHDPMPIKQGSKQWLTWGQIQKALDYVSDVANPQFLTAV